VPGLLASLPPFSVNARSSLGESDASR
jgi:hypothetical protein